MEAATYVYIQVVEKPARRVILKRGNELLITLLIAGRWAVTYGNS